MEGVYGFEFAPDDLVTDADALAESGGRLCYRSFNRPNPATATNAGYLANILSQQHYSVLEHASVTFLVRDVSRALLTELTRHRIDARVDAMLAAGLVAEVQALLAQGYGCRLPAMSALGYRQIGQYLRGECSLAEAAQRIKHDTRVFVRRQANWFKPDDPAIRWFDAAQATPAAVIAASGA